MISDNLHAFLETIIFSELGEKLIELSDDGYNVLVGSTPKKMLLFPTLPNGSPDYSKHPGIYNEKMNSTAAGAFQLLNRYWKPYCVKLHINDFTPTSQREIAIQQIRECRALPLIESGQFAKAIDYCSHIWASLPGAPYGQHTNKLCDLEEYYISKGGFISGSKNA